MMARKLQTSLGVLLAFAAEASAFHASPRLVVAASPLRLRSVVPPSAAATMSEEEEEQPGSANPNDDIGVDFSWDGGTIGIVLGALIALQFFVLANL